MNTSSTRLAILGTISDLHTGPISYDVGSLKQIVMEVSPDLLCAEITKDAWERDDFSKASLEVREVLAPTIASMDIVLIPIAPDRKEYKDFAPNTGWRQGMVKILDRLLRWGQIQADDAKTINGFGFGAFCHSICWLTELFWSPVDRDLWEKQNQELVENILQAIQRDNGRRVLVAVQCQRLHRLLPLLYAHHDLFQIVSYQNL